MYIYKIKNKINNKIYIGQSTKNANESKTYFGSGILIEKAIKKYGIENFEKTILLECSDKTELNEKEKYYILKYKSNIIGYNISDGGNGGNLGNVVNKKISNTIKNMWKDGYYDDVDWTLRENYSPSTETIEKISKSQSGELGYWYGKKLTSEHKEKIKINTKKAYERYDVRQNFIEAMRSDVVRKKISNSLKGNVPWNKGKENVYTEEQLKKMSDSAKNRKIDVGNEKIRREKISKHFLQNHPNRLKIIDNRDGVIYESVKDFCNKTNISWYKTKKLRKDGIINEIYNEGC